ncbi:Aromatic-amino-acid aminotransferase [Planctomycetes bacterium Pla163]|uniref:Aromatic-amino-acid aminotransferase n=1 Tax=Rohdeia mirabilis TaxID=2528008 RepID=A0A518CWM0_9BACT|nr:Aromatic-amino-acid aminotransferase [Planctomycetes bacterium Pla163]
MVALPTQSLVNPPSANAGPLDRSIALIPESQDRPGDDPIFSLNAEALERAATGAKVVNATLGALFDDDGSLAVMQSVFDALRAVPPERAAAYAPIAGPPEFLTAVLDDLYGGHALHEQSVIVGTPGGTGALYDAIVNFTEPGHALLTSSYYWSPYGILADHARRGLTTFRMFDEAGDFDVASLERRLHELLDEQGRALVVLNTPCHNPTGFSLDDDEWRRTVKVLRDASEKGPIALCIDYAYAEFAAERSGSWRDHVAGLIDRVTLLVAWTASKSFTQYGARVGALVASHADPAERERLLNALRYTCRGTWSNCNHLGMSGVADALIRPELRARLESERGDLRALLDARVKVFNEHASGTSLRYPRYEGGFFVSCFTSDPHAVAQRCKAQGLFLVPLQGAVRVALCSVPAADIPFLVEVLDEAVRSVENR